MFELLDYKNLPDDIKEFIAINVELKREQYNESEPFDSEFYLQNCIKELNTSKCKGRFQGYIEGCLQATSLNHTDCLLKSKIKIIGDLVANGCNTEVISELTGFRINEIDILKTIL